MLIVQTTSSGILDHEEARRKNIGGKNKQTKSSKRSEERPPYPGPRLNTQLNYVHPIVSRLLIANMILYPGA